MKICSPQLGLSPESDLGGEVHDGFVIQGLAQRGHKIFVYLPKDRPYKKHPNIIVERAPIKHIPAVMFNLLVVPYLFKTYQREKFGLLRVHSPYFVGLGALFFKLFHPQVPIVCTHHLVEEGFYFRLVNKLTLRKYDAIITVSQFVKNWLVEKYSLSAKKVFVIPNGIFPEINQASNNQVLLKKHRLTGKFIILFMGLLIPRKNPLFLLKVFQKLKEKYPNIALIISGRGPLENDLKNFVKETNLKDVIFTGSVFGQDKIDYFNLCDIFALPSVNEGFGLVITEAMACGKAVIITDAWSAREIVANFEDGLLAKENDFVDWQKKIEIFIANKKLVKEFGRKARQKILSEFNWHKLIPRHEILYMELVNR